jgi:hypothetical protein
LHPLCGIPRRQLSFSAARPSSAINTNFTRISNRNKLYQSTQSVYCRWRGMSESFRPSTFGQQTFIDVPASGSFSGSDNPIMLDATHLYEDNNYQGHSAHPLRFSEHNSYAEDHPFAYALHGHASPTLPSKCNHPAPCSPHLSCIHPVSFHFVFHPFHSPFVVCVPNSLSVPTHMASFWVRARHTIT